MSITLTTPYTVTINGVQVENDIVGACTGSSMDYIANILTYNFKIGTLTGSGATLNLNVGPYAQLQGQNITVALYVGPTTATQTFGQWWLNGILQGTIVPSIDIPTSNLLSDRNTAESFVAVAGGLMPGSLVSWTQL